MQQHLPAELAPAHSRGRNLPTAIAAHQRGWRRAVLLMKRVGAVLLRRGRYIALYCYWTVRHGSTRNVRWVLEFEGVAWH